MGLINWIFDIYQHTQIDKAKSEAASARAELAAVRGAAGGSIDAQRLERALGELALAVKTLQQVMLDKGVCTVDEFSNKLREIDRRDGLLDGRSPVD